MRIDERRLRQMLTCPFADMLGHDILGLIAGGERVTVDDDHGTETHLVDVANALDHLRHLGWHFAAMGSVVG